MFLHSPFCKRGYRVGILILIFILTSIILRHTDHSFQQKLAQILSFLKNDHALITTVPNIVHFFHFVDKKQESYVHNVSSGDVKDLSFVSATCILAAAFNQEPDKIVIHTNQNVTLNLSDKKYWSLIFRVLRPANSPHETTPTTPSAHNKNGIGAKKEVKRKKTKLKVKHLKQPTHVFGQPLSSTFHAADVARVLVLIREGGIALDQDTFIVRQLDPSFFNQGNKVTLGMCKTVESFVYNDRISTVPFFNDRSK